MSQASIEALNARFGIENRLRFEVGAGGLDVALLGSGEASATVALLGATVLSYRPLPGDELLYLSAKSYLEPGKIIRGGIPLCWPWFGAAPRGDASSGNPLPRHGFLRLLEWEVAASSAGKEGVFLELRLSSSPATGTWWPHAFSALCRIGLGDGLSLDFSLENTGREDYAVTGAFHPYFRFGDIRPVAIPALNGSNYDEYLRTAGPGRRGPGAPVFDGEVDRAYACAGPVSIEDPIGRRRIGLESRGADSLVVWTPWKEACAGLPDTPAADYSKFLCVEPALLSPRLLEPGESCGLGLGIGLGAQA
jgi:glucose-6-phosphate 1-epimerase